MSTFHAPENMQLLFLPTSSKICERTQEICSSVIFHSVLRLLVSPRLLHNFSYLYKFHIPTWKINFLFNLYGNATTLELFQKFHQKAQCLHQGHQ